MFYCPLIDIIFTFVNNLWCESNFKCHDEIMKKNTKGQYYNIVVGRLPERIWMILIQCDKNVLTGIGETSGIREKCIGAGRYAKKKLKKYNWNSKRYSNFNFNWLASVYHCKWYVKPAVLLKSKLYNICRCATDGIVIFIYKYHGTVITKMANPEEVKKCSSYTCHLVQLHLRSEQSQVVVTLYYLLNRKYVGNTSIVFKCNKFKSLLIILAFY